MGRVTIDIPDSTHHQLKVMVANLGITMKEYVLEKISPELEAACNQGLSIRQMADAWEERRKDFRLERGKQSFAEIIHDGHKW